MDIARLLLPVGSITQRIAWLSGIVFGLTFLYSIAVIAYNLFLHPLRKFPGPILARSSRLYWAWLNLAGRRHLAAADWHAKYGEVVRVAPDQLSFIGENAWKDIYMHKQGRPQFQKRRNNKPITSGVSSIINADDETHARQRKMLSHAFSDRALREQEVIVKEYIDLLMSNLRDDAKNMRPVDIVSSFNFTTFDIIGDLSFGESFHNLEQRRPHPWLTTIFGNIRTISLIETLALLPGGNIFIAIVARLLKSKSFKNSHFQIHKHAEEHITKRIERGDQRPDFMTKVLPHKREDGTGISRAEIDATIVILIIGGSETTATLLSGAVYHLSRNPRVLNKLQDEVRGAFQSTEEIDILKASQLHYLFAVIEESLRLYAPVPVALTRLIPPEGASVCGHWVEGDTWVGIPQRAAYRSPVNFVEPLSFIPERWMPEKDSKFEKDRKAIFQPFSAGPRNCLGKNLAYAEMRLILARFIYEFEFEMVDPDQQWDNQRVFILYDKPPLMIRVKSRAT